MSCSFFQGKSSSYNVFQQQVLNRSLQYLRLNPHCPACDSVDIVRSQRISLREVLMSSLIRIWPLRCNHCSSRWLVFNWVDPKRKLN
jgi:hypothetical protein